MDSELLADVRAQAELGQSIPASSIRELLDELDSTRREVVEADRDPERVIRTRGWSYLYAGKGRG